MRAAIIACVLHVVCAVVSPVAWWPAEGSPVDITGHLGGRAVGNVSYVPGVVGQAFYFTGDSYITAANAQQVIPSSEITVAFWLYLLTYPGGSSCCAHFVSFDSPGTFISHIGIDGGYIPPYFWLQSASFIVTAPQRVPLSTWTFMAFAYNGNTAYEYWNGTLVDSRVIYASLLWGDSTYIANSQNEPRILHGYLDEMQFYSTCLSATDVSTLFLQAIMPQPTTAPVTTPPLQPTTAPVTSPLPSAPPTQLPNSSLSITTTVTGSFATVATMNAASSTSGHSHNGAVLIPSYLLVLFVILLAVCLVLTAGIVLWVLRNRMQLGYIFSPVNNSTEGDESVSKF